MSYLNYLIAKYRNKGIVVDTNILLLFFVGTFNENEIEKFKNTLKYTIQDFQILCLLFKFFKIFITPNILTELTNISDSLNAKTSNNFFIHIKNITSNISENYVVSNNAMSNNSFLFYGLTDSTLDELAKQGFLILTDDLPLYNYLICNGREAINFNHIRTEFMIK